MPQLPWSTNDMAAKALLNEDAKADAEFFHQNQPLRGMPTMLTRREVHNDAISDLGPHA